MVDVEKLVSEAKEVLKKRQLEKISSDKVSCTTEEIKALLKEGATSININQMLIKREAYLHTVSYEGITFVNVTEKPVRELKRYSVKP